MTRNVYVIFQDHYSGWTDKWENFDDVGRFINVAGTKESARAIIEDLVLGAYYDRCTGADGELWEADHYDWYELKDDILRFDVVKDEYDMIEVKDDRDTNIYYFEEFDITFED